MKDALAHYHKTLILCILEHTKIIIEFYWNETFGYVFVCLWVSLEKREWFDFSHSLGSLPYLIQSELDS